MGAEDWGGGVKCYLPRVMTPVEVQVTGIEPEHSSPNFVWAARSADNLPYRFLSLWSGSACL